VEHLPLPPAATMSYDEAKGATARGVPGGHAVDRHTRRLVLPRLLQYARRSTFEEIGAMKMSNDERFARRGRTAAFKPGFTAAFSADSSTTRRRDGPKTGNRAPWHSLGTTSPTTGAAQTCGARPKSDFGMVEVARS